MQPDQLPKIELHLHLDCSVTFEVAQQLSPALTRSQFEREFKAPAKCRDLADFLTCAIHSVELMQTREALRLVTEALFNVLRADNVAYAEIRYAPLLHTERGLDPDGIVEEVNAAVKRGRRETGVDARVILCTLRHFNAEQSMETARLVERYRGTPVVALDIAGDEAGYPLDPHVAAFDYVQERGLHRTAHAGEGSGPQSVWETLRRLHPERLGHGVRSVEDEALIAYVREHGIHLEVCPTSNVQTNVVDSYGQHPIDQLYRQGVSVGINTDCRTINNVSGAEEYQSLRQHFGWTSRQLLDCNLQAVDAAFAEDDVKRRLRERLIAAYGEPGTAD